MRCDAIAAPDPGISGLRFAVDFSLLLAWSRRTLVINDGRTGGREDGRTQREVLVPTFFCISFVFFLLFFVANLVTDISISVTATATGLVAAAGRGTGSGRGAFPLPLVAI